MVAQHYRWDFIQLSTDEKPTPATSEKVADGSTLYTSDDSKYYVWYKDQWYEKTGEEPGPGPGPVDTSNNINFYDLDGNIVASWTLEELADKTELPENPEAPEGLTAKGWNWTLEDLQEETTPINVGQLYAPTDGKTHLFVSVDDDHLTPNLAIGINGTATVDWGDESETTTLSGSSVDAGQGSSHTYSEAGEYEVTIDIPEGSQGKIRGNSNYVSFLWKKDYTQQSLNADNQYYGQQLRKVWLGNNIVLGPACFNYLGIEELVIPDTYSGNTIPESFLSNCFNYNKPIILPPVVTSIGNYFCSVCYLFNSILSFPKTLATIGTHFLVNCGNYNMPICFSSGLTSIGNSFLGYNSYSVSYNQPIYLPGVTHIGSSFITSVSFDSNIYMPKVENIGASFLNICYGFSKKLVLPSSLTTIGSNFIGSAQKILELETNTTTVPSTGLFSFYCNVPSYTKGITLTGTGASAWKAGLPDSTTAQGYRKLIDGTV